MKDLFSDLELKETGLSKTEILAHQYTVTFSDPIDLPECYKSNSMNDKNGKNKAVKDSVMMRNFKKRVSVWENVIETVLNNFDSEQAWRILNVKPNIHKGVFRVMCCEDFVALYNYYAEHRDEMDCDFMGCMAKLLGENQSYIERYLKRNFVALDFETANDARSSVNSVAIVQFEQGEIVDQFQTLIQPPNNAYNFHTTMKNNISAKDTVDAPLFSEVYPEIEKRLRNRTVVAHNAFSFDRKCLEQSMQLYNIQDNLNIEWIDTYRIAGCGLEVCCETNKIELLNHHESLCDAQCCGMIYDLFLTDKLIRSEKANTQIKKQEQKLSGDIYKPDFKNCTNTDNPFYKKKVVLSGIDYTERSELANLLKKLGADIDSSVSKKTNYLIIDKEDGFVKIEKMKQNISENREAKICTVEEAYNLLNKYII